MIKRYIKLVYISLFFALFVALITTGLNSIIINSTIVNKSLLTLVLIQLSVYIYIDFKWISSLLKTKIKVSINYYIEFAMIPINNIGKIIHLKTITLQKLKVIRC